ncbi:MAG: hypothetical protein QOH88_1464 [Verrucomicrobiota bacterium]|jgi:hypothetical protein
MRLVNESGQPVAYWIQSAQGGPNCGEIPVDGYVDQPNYDNQTDVYVGFNVIAPAKGFVIHCDNTGTDQQVQMALVVEEG